MRRTLAGLTLAFALTALPAAAQEASGFDPARFVGRGDTYNCPDFASQADAQAVLRADPTDPNRLDADKDGIACETRPNPKDLVPVVR
jgi:Excalibur calcium-binding domain